MARTSPSLRRQSMPGRPEYSLMAVHQSPWYNPQIDRRHIRQAFETEEAAVLENDRAGQSASQTGIPGLRDHIVTTPGVRGGKPRIAGHRITVADVAIWHERMGMSPDKIVSEYPAS
jgi:uncharacterized protein (DUF433 family)